MSTQPLRTRSDTDQPHQLSNALLTYLSLDLNQTVSIFRQARVVVGMHGAGLLPSQPRPCCSTNAMLTWGGVLSGQALRTLSSLQLVSRVFFLRVLCGMSGADVEEDEGAGGHLVEFALPQPATSPHARSAFCLMLREIWSLVSGLWSLVFGRWSLISGARCLESEI